MIAIHCPKCEKYLFSINDSGAVMGAEIKCRGCKETVSIDFVTQNFLYNSHLTSSLSKVIIK